MRPPGLAGFFVTWALVTFSKSLVKIGPRVGRCPARSQRRRLRSRGAWASLMVSYLF